MRALITVTAVMLVAATALALTPTQSHAGTIDPTGYSVQGQSVRIYGPSGTLNTSAGRFTWTGNAISSPQDAEDVLFDGTFNAYCIEWQGANTSSNWTTATDITTAAVPGGGLGFADSQLTATQATALEELFGRYFPDVDTNMEMAAFQIAIWEIVYENKSGGASSADAWNVKLGDARFDIGGNGVYTDAAENQANIWLASLNGSGVFAYDLVALISNTNQDQIREVPGTRTVPLPPAALLGFGMLGALGLVRFRRRRTT